MPIWLRRFTFAKIEEFYKKEKEEYDKASKKSSSKSKTPLKPSIRTKARK